MVTQLRNRAGKTHLGCLLTLILVVAVAYVGANVGEVYWRFYQVRDYASEQAEFAPALTDDVIRRRLVAFSDTLGLDLGPKAWTVRRSSSPREITIQAQYEDSVVLRVLGMRKVWKIQFKPSARAPL
jgi:hypothetical protein